MLVVVAHPDLGESVLNQALAARAVTIDGVELFDLQAAYPDFVVDVAAEHDRLRRHDRIVLQHPIHWYSSPPILKQWLDSVLTPGFAYAGSRELRGKQLCSAVTCGAPGDAYTAEGWNRYRMNQFLAPFHATAHFCRMAYLQPFVVYDVASLQGATLERELDRYEEWLVGAGVEFDQAR